MQRSTRLIRLFAVSLILVLFPVVLVAQEAPEATTWPEAVRAIRADKKAKMQVAMKTMAIEWTMQFDWLEQDLGAEMWQVLLASNPDLEKKALAKVYEELDGNGPQVTGDDWASAYEKACLERRALRLKPLLKQCDTVVFTKHFNMGGSHYAYTEALSDAQAERNFAPGTALCLLDLKTMKVENLIEDADGVIRDPDISFDGKKILFSWKKSDRSDDYHLYEMDVETKKIRQITFGLGFADYEGIYLPGGDILFNSTRCVQTTDCWHTETSSMYRCDKDGKYMRRLGFDQVATNYPQLMDDGRVTYTRWEYNDRGQLYPQPLFQMNPDGTGQTEYYGNNSWFPTTILHARGVPGSHKVVAISSGHHSRQGGKLMVIDNLKGRKDALGIDYLHPRRPAKDKKVDAADQDGDQYQYPYAFSEKDIIVTLAPKGYSDAIGAKVQKGRSKNGYGIFFINGETATRELLSRDEKLSSNQPIPLIPRRRIYNRPSVVDYRKDSGTYFMQDVYVGPGLKDVPRGTIKKIRVISIAFREADICGNRNGGPAGGAFVSMPCSCDNGAWDPKIILGDATVHEDGSACFKVPARVPVYFQCLDENNQCVQTMRSWSTLMPGETFSCVGCHEDKNSTPVRNMFGTRAFKSGVAELEPFYGPARGFSFVKEIQPILDKHCVKCHVEGGKNPKFVLTGEMIKDTRAGRFWTKSYMTLTQRGRSNKWVNWISVQSVPSMLDPYSGGAVKSELFKHLTDHNNVKLSQEDRDKLAAWMDLLVPYTGDNFEQNAWDQRRLDQFERFDNKRKYMEAIERQNLEEYITLQTGKPFIYPLGDDPNPYRNVALNPGDVKGESKKFPHATSNSEYGNKDCFAARNCINGNRANGGHGPKFPSWGPDRRDDLWWAVEFAVPVATDRVDIFIRADFPHDTHWHSATLEFSDGSKVDIKLEKTHGRQSFYFPRRITKFVKITNLQQEKPQGWCGLSEVEVWGRTHIPGEETEPVVAISLDEYNKIMFPNKAQPAKRKPQPAKAILLKNVNTLVPNALDGKGCQWKFTTSDPGKNWNTPAFDDKRWKTGQSGFGTTGTPGSRVGTPWNGKDIWLRRTFTLEQMPVGKLIAQLHHDENCEIYLNGQLVLQQSHFVTRYIQTPLGPDARKALKKGENTIAVHCRQTSGGQFIDVGIFELKKK